MKPEVIDLIEKYMEFSKTTRNYDLKVFSVWLNRSFDGDTSQKRSASEIQTDRDISYLINRIGRFSRFHTRKVLSKHGMISIDEFYFLLSIDRLGSPSKNEVYRDVIIELPTGAQIMKRMTDNGLVKEVADEKDKRVKRVNLTEKGKEIKTEIFEDLTGSVKLKTGNLTAEEKNSLLQILRKLDHFHTDIYEKDADKPIDQLIRKYLLQQ